ncbi:MAG: translation initiation factor IF-2, partial [Anaerolineaceae bacterium]
PQTIEALNHAQAADVPIVIAINKIDVKGANPSKIRQQLTEYNLVAEEYGGDVVAVPVSALTGAGLDELLESINLVAEISELKANPNRPGIAVVVEAELDPSRGPVATVLVQNGTVRQGDALVAGETSGKVKAMFNDRGERIKEAGPSSPVVIMGLEQVPEAGERIRVVSDEREARIIVETRRRSREADEQTDHAHVNLDTLFNEISAGKLKELILILKADVRGSAEAVKGALERLGTSEVKVKVIHSATGPVSDSDVMLAEASNGIIIAFNIKTDPSARKRADATGVEIRPYTIIYQAIEEIEKALAGMYEPTFAQVVDGHAEVRQIFKSSRLGGIAGSFVLDGTLKRGSTVRILRKDAEIGKGRCEGLKRFADDVREVQAGYECGIVIGGFDKFVEGDVVEFFHEERTN